MNESLADRIKRIRKQKQKEDMEEKSKWSLNELGKRMGITGQALSLIENNKTKKLSVELAERLSKEFGISIEYLLYGQSNQIDVVSLEIPFGIQPLLSNNIKINVKKCII